MPVSGDSEHRCGQRVDLVGQLLLTDAAADHFASLDLVEQLRRVRLGVQKPFHPQVFVEDRLCHNTMLRPNGALMSLVVPPYERREWFGRHDDFFG
jgi:hypothetical protein